MLRRPWRTRDIVSMQIMQIITSQSPISLLEMSVLSQTFLERGMTSRHMLKRCPRWWNGWESVRYRHCNLRQLRPIGEHSRDCSSCRQWRTDMATVLYSCLEMTADDCHHIFGTFLEFQVGAIEVVQAWNDTRASAGEQRKPSLHKHLQHQRRRQLRDRFLPLSSAS